MYAFRVRLLDDCLLLALRNQTSVILLVQFVATLTAYAGLISLYFCFSDILWKEPNQEVHCAGGEVLTVVDEWMPTVVQFLHHSCQV